MAKGNQGTLLYNGESNKDYFKLLPMKHLRGRK